MKYHRPTVSQSRNPQSCSSSGFRLLVSAVFLLPSACLAQVKPPPTDNTDSNLSTPKNVPLNIVLPEGYPISGRRAKLVKLPDDPRWFLMFDEAIQKLTPELVPKNAKKNDKTALSLPKTGKKTPKTDQNSSKPDKNVSPIVSEKNLESENPFSRPFEVLPGKRLTAMTYSIGNQADQSLDFRVWGEVTTYHNRNYILPTFVASSRLFGTDAAEYDKTPKKINPLEAAFGPPNSAEPKFAKQTQIPDKAMIPKNLRDALSSIPRTRPLELPDIKQSPARPKPTVAVPIKSDAKKTSIQNNWRDGYMIIDRVGRIHFDPEGLQWLFTFEADGTSLAEPPVTLHPCRLLEIMEDTVGRSADTLRFRISGQISQYQGRNYLLLRKVLMVYDLGNLVK